MTGTPVAHLLVDALKNEYPRAVHITELANLTGISVTSTSSSMNNRLERGYGDVERVSRGVWKYVPPPKSKTRTPQGIVKTAAPVVVATTLPKSLKVVGTTAQGLLAVDLATNESYVATKM